MPFKGVCRIRWERGGKKLPVFFCRREKVNVSAQIYVATVRLNINQTATDSSCTVPNSNSIICLLLTQCFSQRQIILWKVLAAGNRKTFIDQDFVVRWVFCDVVGFLFFSLLFWSLSELHLWFNWQNKLFDWVGWTVTPVSTSQHWKPAGLREEPPCCPPSVPAYPHPGERTCVLNRTRKIPG